MTNTKPHLIRAAFVLAMLAVLSGGSLAHAESKVVNVELDHSKPDAQRATVPVLVGDQLKVSVKNSCKAVFVAKILGYESALPQAVQTAEELSEATAEAELLEAAVAHNDKQLKVSSSREAVSDEDLKVAQAEAFENLLGSLTMEQKIVINKELKEAKIAPRDAIKFARGVLASKAKAAIEKKGALESKLAKQLDCSKPETLELKPVFNTGEYPAYEVMVEYAEGLTPAQAAAAQQIAAGKDPNSVLKETRFLVQVDSTPEWQLIGTGGFTASKLVNARYAARPAGSAECPGSGQCIVRDRAGEDRYGLGVAAFFHARRSNWVLRAGPFTPTVNASFGLGVNNGTKLSYFAGPSFGLGDTYLTLGVNVGAVDSLAAGFREGDTVTDANTLSPSSLSTRTAARAFIGISYKFLGNEIDKSFKAPFAPATGAPKATEESAKK